MILTGKEIQAQMKSGNIKIDPAPKSFNPNSVNVTLGNTLLEYPKNCFFALDGKTKDWIGGIFDIIEPKKIIIDYNYILQPDKVYLAHTNEITWSDTFVPMLEGRSTWGRRFLEVHVTAGFGDVGFNGQWTLELVPHCYVEVRAGVEIAQVYFHELKGEIDLYNGKYQGDRGAVAAKPDKEFAK